MPEFKDQQLPPKASPLAGRGSFNLGFIPGGPSTSQYDKGTTLLDREDINASRAARQPWYDELGNTAINLATTVFGQAVESLGSITDGIFNIMSENDIAPNEGLTGVGQDIVNWGANEHPVYWDPKEGTWLNGSYIASRIPSVASSLSMLIPGFAASRLAGGVGRALRLGSNIEKVMAVGAGGVMMRHAENWMESAQIYDQTLKQYLQGQNFDGMNEEQKMLASEEAKKVAMGASDLNYKMNWTNLAFDLMQMSMVLKPVSGIFSKIFGNTRLGSTLDYGYNTTVARGMMGGVESVLPAIEGAAGKAAIEGAGAFQKALLKSISTVRPFAAQFTEGIEEGVNQISQYEAQRDAAINAGTLKDDGSTLMQRITKDYINRFDTKDAMAWGIIGGVAFQMGGSAIANAQNKNGFWNNVTEQAERISAIKSRQDHISEFTRTYNDPKSTTYDKEVARHNLVFNLAQSNRQSDTLDLLVADLKNPKLIGQLAKNMNITYEDASKMIPGLVEDIEWINNSINEYEGGGWNRNKKEKINTAILPEDSDMEDFKTSNRRLGNYADPRLAMQLAYNDYSMKVRDRINESALKEVAEVRKQLYGSENLSINAQQYLNADSDIKALNTARFHFQSKLDEAKSLNLSKTVIDQYTRAIERLDQTIKQKTKEQDIALSTIQNNLKDDSITGETPLDRIEELKKQQLPVSQIISKKTTFFINQADKQLIQDTNARILKDPKAFELETIEDMRKITKKNEADKVAQEEKIKDETTAKETVAALYSTPEFAAFYKEAAENLDKALSSRDDIGKENYLRSEYEQINKSIADGLASGKLDTSSTESLKTKFDKDLFMRLRAREKAVAERMPKKPEVKTPAPAGKKTTTTTKTKNEGDKTNYKNSPAGSPPDIYVKYKADLFRFTELMVAERNEVFPFIELEKSLAEAQAAMIKLQEFGNKLDKAVSETEKDAIEQSAIPFIKEFKLELTNDKGNFIGYPKIKDAIKRLQPYIEDAVPKLPTFDQLLESNEMLMQLLPFSRSVVNGKVEPNTEFTKLFFGPIAGQFKTLRDVVANYNKVDEMLQQKLEELKGKADLYFAGKEYGGAKETVIKEEDSEKIEFALDSNKESMGVASRRTTDSERENPLRAMHPGSNESYSQPVMPFVMEVKEIEVTKNGVTTKEKISVAKRDKLGRFMPNGGYQFWPGHHFEYNSNPGPSYVRSGDTLTVKYRSTPFGPDLMLYKNGKHVGNIDSSERLNKALVKAERLLSEIDQKLESNKAKVQELTNSISRYKQLIPKIEKMEKTMAAVKGPMEIKVRDSVIEGKDIDTSGGVYFGKMFMTEVYDKNGVAYTNPLSIRDAFGDRVNNNGDVLLTVYYNGVYYSNQGGNMVNVTEKFSDIVIPESQLNKYLSTVDKSYNSKAFALIPTNTLTKDGKHIYMPVQLYTRMLNDMRLTADGREGGLTLIESMFSSMMNPDKNTAAFGNMVEYLGLTSLYKKGLPIAEQSRKFIDAFYTTENLLRIFNTVAYVYDGAKEFKSPTKNADYSKHIGLDVFYPKNSSITEERQAELDKKAADGTITDAEAREGKRFPILRIDLGNDSGEKNTYAIRLLDDNGKFNPTFGKTEKMRGQLMTRSEREEVTDQGLPTAYQIVTVDVLEEINKRMNQKMFRVDKERIGDTINSGQYKGFSFDKAGKLVMKTYKSYMDYLSDNQFIESTVHGMEVRSPDGKERSRNYFYNRSFFLEDELTTPGKTGKEPVAKKKTVTKVNKKTLKEGSVGEVVAENPAQKSVEDSEVSKVTEDEIYSNMDKEFEQMDRVIKKASVSPNTLNFGTLTNKYHPQRQLVEFAAKYGIKLKTIPGKVYSKDQISDIKDDIIYAIKEKFDNELQSIKERNKEVASELPDTYIINGKPVSQQEFDTAIDNAKNTKEALDVEYNGDDEVRIQKIIDLGGTSQAGTTTITDEAPTTTTEVTKPVQQDAGVPEQQGTKEAVSESTEPIGQGNAETTTTVLEKGNSGGVGGDVEVKVGDKVVDADGVEYEVLELSTSRKGVPQAVVKLPNKTEEQLQETARANVFGRNENRLLYKSPNDPKFLKEQSIPIAQELSDQRAVNNSATSSITIDLVDLKIKAGNVGIEKNVKVQDSEYKGVTGTTLVNVKEKDGIIKATFTGTRSDKPNAKITLAGYRYGDQATKNPLENFEKDYGVKLKDVIDAEDFEIAEITVLEERAEVIPRQGVGTGQSVTLRIKTKNGDILNDVNITVNKRKFTEQFIKETQSLPIQKVQGVEKNVINVAIPNAILNSISAKNKGDIKLSKNKDKYIINGKEYTRVSDFIGSTFTLKVDNINTIAGNFIDSAAKDFFDRNLKSAIDYNMSNEAMQSLLNQLKFIRTNFVSGETVVGTGVVVYGIIDGKNVAGEIDMLTIDAEGNFRIYDYKSSSDVFTDSAYNKPVTGNGITRSKKEQHNKQLSTYSILLEQMTGTTATDKVIIPMTLDITPGDTDGALINNIIPYPAVHFGPNEEVTNEPEVPEQTDDDGDLFFDEDDEVGFGQNTPEGSMMADLVPISDDDIFNMNKSQNEKSLKLIYQDPGKLRAYGHTMGFQVSATEFVGDIITKALYNRRIVENDTSAMNMAEIKDAVLNEINRITENNNKRISKGKYLNANKMLVTLSKSEIATTIQQNKDIERVKRYLDFLDMSTEDKIDSKDFVGYIRLAMMDLNSSKIVNISFSEDSGEVEMEDDELSYTTRFAENYAVKIDPRSTVTIDAKIILSQMRQLDRINNPDGGHTFLKVTNRFGTPKNYNLAGVLNELHIEFEEIYPDRFIQNLRVISEKSPYVKSLFQTIDRLAKGDRYKQDDFYNKLSSLIKQHREMLFASVRLGSEDNPNVSVTFGEAARQGIKEKIIEQWQHNFNDNFRNLFDLKEIPEDNGEVKYDAKAKDQVVSFSNNKESYNEFNVQLPDDYNILSYPFTRMYRIVYDQLKSAVKKGKVKMNFTFDSKSNLLVDGKKTVLTTTDVFRIASMFQLNTNIVFNNNLKKEIELNKDVFSKTYLEQITGNISFLLKRKGSIVGDETTKKSFNGYDPIIYKLMASQMQRLGIQLAEDPDDSYLVLADLNSPVDGSKRFMKFQRYDNKIKDFISFMTNNIETLIVKPLVAPGAFVPVKEFVGNEQSEVVVKERLSIDNPLSRSRLGLDPFALHARTEWVKFSNEVIRNAAGDLEYTYNPHNTLSLWINKMKDANSNFVQKLAETPMGRFNVWIQSLAKPDSQALSDFKLKYIDGGKINNFKSFSPERMTMGIEQLIGWNAYMNGEEKSSGRKKGYFITTHGDSTNMPAFLFDKDVIDMILEEYEDADGVMQHRINIPEVSENGIVNPIYEKLYGIFRGELERVAQGYQIFNDIMSQPEENRLKYAFENYTLNVHFKTKETENGTIVSAPGNNVNFYFLGSTLFNKPNGTKLYNSNRTGLDFDYGLVDNSGTVNEDVARQRFSEILPVMANEMIEDAYKGALQQEGDFFKIKSSVQRNDEDSKHIKLDIEFPYLNGKSVNHYRGVLFQKHAKVLNSEGGLDSTSTLNNFIERKYDKRWLDNADNLPTIVMTVDGIEKASTVDYSTFTPSEIEAYKESFIKIKDQEREEDTKKARAPYALLKYMIADRVLNEYVFRASLYQATFDPSIVTKSNNYQEFFYDFTKRNTSLVAPGDVLPSDPDRDHVRVVGFKDHSLGDIFVEYTAEEFDNLDPAEQRFLKAFKENLPKLMKGNRYPARAIEYTVAYESRPKIEKEAFWPVLRDKLLKMSTTDAGSYMTGREFAFRLYKMGKINKNDYYEAVQSFYDGYLSDKLSKKLGLGVVKYVNAGPNIFTHDDEKSSLLQEYVKNAEFPLIKGITVFNDSKLYRLAEHLESIEKKEYSGYSYSEPYGGIVALPPSAHKLGFSSNAKLYDELGNTTDEILSAPVLKLDRGFLRQQIESSRADKDRATVSIQSAKFKGLNIPSYWRFGRSGFITFSPGKEESEYMSANERNELIGVEEENTSSSGLNANQIEISNYRIYREMAIKKIKEESRKMGFEFNEELLDYKITDVDKFISNIVEHAMDQYGMSSNAVDYLKTVPGENRMKFNITMTPNSMRFQSIITSQLQKIFYRFTMPGGAYATISATGIIAGSGLKSYRNKTVTKTFADDAAISRNLNEEEIVTRTLNKDGSITVEYNEVIPGEAIMPWNFKDSNGKLLPYEDFVNENGTIKMIEVNGKMVNAIDDELLHIIVNRIPNTGPNTMSRLKAIRFFPKYVRDAIAMAPEIVDIYNADHDYDKLYTYLYNHEIVDGRLVKQRSVFHYTQNGITDFVGSENARREFARNKLMQNDSDYAALTNDVIAGEMKLKEFEEQVVSGNNPAFRNWANITVGSNKELEFKINKLKEIENILLQDEEFIKEYESSSIFSRQSIPQLENALLDGYHIMLGDFKMMRQSTEFLNADWLHGQLERKIEVPGATGLIKKSLMDMYEESEYFNIASYWTLSKVRASNSEASRMVGIMANMQTSMYLSQRYGLSYNAKWAQFSDTPDNIKKFDQYSSMTDYELDDAGIDPNSIEDPASNPAWRYYVIFKDNKGSVKKESQEGYNSFDKDNMPYKHPGSPQDAYTAYAPNSGQIYRWPTTGRYRYDRIYVIDNNGNRVNVSTAIQSVLQAFLDNKNNPVRGYLNINSKTSNAFMSMILQGYVDEAPLVLMQESVKKYINRINQSTKVDSEDSISYTKAQIKTIAEILQVDEKVIWDKYRNLVKDKTKNIFYLLGDLIKEYGTNRSLSVEDFGVSENDLSSMLSMQLNYSTKSNDYAVSQLKVLRTFLLSDKYGRELFNVQQATSADSKGLKNSFAGLEIQRNQFNNLFKIKDGKFYSSAGSVAGLHRITPYWARQVKADPNGPDSQRSNWLPGMPSFTYSYGIKPAYDLLSSISDANVFYEFSPLFKTMQKLYGTVSGNNILKLNPKEQERVVKKLNINFVSYLYSNPVLYRGFFNTDEEYNFFVEYGRRALTLPDTSLPVNENFNIFNAVESVAASLKKLSEMETVDPETKQSISYKNQYEILNALIAIPSTNDKRPTSVYLPAASRYQDNLSQRLHISLAAMMESGNTDLERLAKKIILYAYAAGGVTTPTSYVQHIPPYLLSKLKLDTILYHTMQNLTDYNTTMGGKRELKRFGKDAVKTFMIQYMQHNRFEMNDTVDSNELELLPADPNDPKSKAGYIGFNEKVGRMVIKFQKVPDMEKFIVKYQDRLFVKTGGRNSRLYKEIDYAGVAKYHNNEYNFNTNNLPVNSIYYGNRAEKAISPITGDVEINFEIKAYDENNEEDADLREAEKNLAIPFKVKLNNYINKGNVLLNDLMMDLRSANRSGLPSAVFTHMESVAKQLETRVYFTNEPGGGWRQYIDYNNNSITINIGHKAYNMLDDFNEALFSEDLAHEVGHLGTAKGIMLSMDSKQRKKAESDYPGMVESVDRLIKLKELVEKNLSNVDSEAGKNFRKYSQLIARLNKMNSNGNQDKLSTEDQLFIEEHSYFRALLDTDNNKRFYENEAIGSMLEFATYAYSNEKFQNILNGISFKDDKKTKTLWQKIKEVLADIIGFFGLGNSEQSQSEIARIQKKLTPIAKGIKYKNDRPVGFKAEKGEVPESIANIKEYSALHVALTNLIDIKDAVSNIAGVGKITADILSKSQMADLQRMDSYNIDRLYDGVSNYSSSWPDEIKKLYHQATMNGSVIC